jgi:hypothetical protein
MPVVLKATPVSRTSQSARTAQTGASAPFPSVLPHRDSRELSTTGSRPPAPLSWSLPPCSCPAASTVEAPVVTGPALPSADSSCAGPEAPLPVQHHPPVAPGRSGRPPPALLPWLLSGEGLRSRRVRHHSQRGRRVDDRHHHPPVARGRGLPTTTCTYTRKVTERLVTHRRTGRRRAN